MKRQSLFTHIYLLSVLPLHRSILSNYLAIVLLLHYFCCALGGKPFPYFINNKQFSYFKDLKELPSQYASFLFSRCLIRHTWVEFILHFLQRKMFFTGYFNCPISDFFFFFFFKRSVILWREMVNINVCKKRKH